MSLSSLADKVCPPVCRPLLDRVQSSPIGKRIASGAFWLVAGSGLAKIFTFVAMIFVVRILGKETFGEFGLIRSTATTFVAFSSFGLGLTATKYIAELLHTDKERTGRIISLTYVFTFFSSLIVAIVFYTLAPWLCETQLHKPHLVNVMRVGAILLFLTTFMGTQISVLTGFQDFRGLAIVMFAVGVITIPVYVIGTYYWGLYGGVLATIVTAGLNVLINSGIILFHKYKYQIRYSFHGIFKEMPVLWNFNLPIVLSNSIYGVTIWGCQILLTVQPNGMSELSVYYVVMNLQIVMLFLPQQFLPVIFPVLSEINGQRDKKLFWRVIQKSWLFVFCLSLVVVIPFMLFPKIFMGLFGIDFAGNWRVLIAACIFVLTSSGTMVANQIFICRGKNWLQLIINIVWSLLYCCIVIVMLNKNLGASGLFWAATICNVIYQFSVALYIYLNKNLTCIDFKLF